LIGGCIICLKAGYIKILGVNFFNGTLTDSLVKAKNSLVVAPSGPGLASDLIKNKFYKESLENADIVLPDSGLMCFLLNWIMGKRIKRLSGLKFLKKFLSDFDSFESSFWIMPNVEQGKSNIKWINDNYRFKISDDQVYIAPYYDRSSPVDDPALLLKIQKLKPTTIFIQLGGGIQEQLGLFLKRNLNYRSSILCTGAAIAFLSREQSPIPDWVDKFYMGWMVRCLYNPKVFVPRYLAAFKLVYLLLKYGGRSPS
jgi:UDP-N-acetyl-D-mannosaminuronic acid transferase (WecB/TagA/CpsF family)